MNYDPVAKAIIGKREVSCHGPNRKYVDGVVIQQLKEIEPETLLYTHPPAEVVRELVDVLRVVRGKHGCGALNLPIADLERVDSALIKAKEHGL